MSEVHICMRCTYAYICDMLLCHPTCIRRLIMCILTPYTFRRPIPAFYTCIGCTCVWGAHMCVRCTHATSYSAALQMFWCSICIDWHPICRSVEYHNLFCHPTCVRLHICVYAEIPTRPTRRILKILRFKILYFCAENPTIFNLSSDQSTFYICMLKILYIETWYGVATITRLLKIIGLFCRK